MSATDELTLAHLESVWLLMDFATEALNQSSSEELMPEVRREWMKAHFEYAREFVLARELALSYFDDPISIIKAMVTGK